MLHYSLIYDQFGINSHHELLGLFCNHMSHVDIILIKVYQICHCIKHYNYWGGGGFVGFWVGFFFFFLVFFFLGFFLGGGGGCLTINILNDSV